MHQLSNKLIVPAISMVLEGRAEDYFKLEIVGTDLDYSRTKEKLRMHFYSGVSRDNYLRHLNEVTISQYNTLGISNTDVVRHLVYKARRLQAVLGGGHLVEQVLINKLIQLVKDVGPPSLLIARVRPKNSHRQSQCLCRALKQNNTPIP